MTVGRRRIFELGALAAGSAAVEACSGARPVPIGIDEVEHLLNEIDRVVGNVEQLDADAARFGIHGGAAAAHVARGREHCLGLLTTLCFMGTYRNVPEAIRDDPRVKAHLERTLPRIRSVVEGARAHLDGMSEEELDAIDRRLLRDSDLPMRSMEQVDDYAKEGKVPLDQRAYLRVSTAELSSRFRYQGVLSASRKLSSSFGRVEAAAMAKLGVEERSEEPSPSTGLLSMPAEGRLGSVDESCVVDEDCTGRLRCSVGACRPMTSRSDQLMDDAWDVTKIGLWLLIPPACGVGVLVLLTSLFMVIVSGILHSSED